MTYRSLRPGRRNADASQSPENQAASAPPKPRREIFYGGQVPRRTPARQVLESGAPLQDYSNPEGLGGLRRRPPSGPTPTSDGLTVVMPAAKDPNATVVIPVPPSSRGRHVLDVLSAEAPDLTAYEDPGPVIRNAADHVIDVLAPRPERGLRTLAMAAAVHLFRRAKDMARARESWCDEADRRLQRQHARLVEFNASWDERLHQMSAEACGQRITAAGYGMAECYATEGTAVTLGMAAEIRRMIVADSLAKTGVTQ